MPRKAIACPPDDPEHGVIARRIYEQLCNLRMDLAWLDQHLTHQAGGPDDEARTLRLEMRMRCDGMRELVQGMAANLGRIVIDPARTPDLPPDPPD